MVMILFDVNGPESALGFIEDIKDHYSPTPAPATPLTDDMQVSASE